MSRPNRYLIRMALFLILVALGVTAILDPVRTAFMANPPLNGLILGVLLFGILFNVRQVMLLGPEINWLEKFQSGQPLTSDDSPRLLGPMQRMLGEKHGRLALSPLATRSLLDGIDSRLEEARDIARYLTGLSIFLGLLGTFWGLLDTVSAIGHVISSLSITGDDITTVFTELKSGLEAPMRGMGTSFSSSLFGLAGSLVLGFMDLQSGQAQNQFYNQLEDWLAGQTRVSSGSAVAEGEASVPAYIQALLEQTADSLNELQRTLAGGEKDRAETTAHLRALGSNLTTLVDQMRTEQHLLLKMVETQAAMNPTLQRMAEETISGREKMAHDLRSEFKLLARTIAATADANKKS
ncbi:MAG: flagellar motor protein MotA [Alphaproteobacteria bacterium RIFOXYD12_FULL_60_8]|nr:MAG: flagellar motor protein MotA [Alphaproteobacteria bacterium RIFOXYD12_FULL_60_8]